MDITWKSIWRFFAVLIVISALIILRDIVFIVLFAVIIASSIDVWSDWLKYKIKIPQILSVLLMYLIFVTLIGWASYFIFPVLISEIQGLVQTVLQSPTVGSEKIPLFGEGFKSVLLTVAQTLQTYANNILGIFMRLLGGIFSTITIVVISFYLAIQEKGVEKFLTFISPPRHREWVIIVWRRSQKKFSQWLSSQIIISLLMSVATYAAMRILGVQYAGIIAILAGILEIIPYAGPVVTGVIAVLLTLPQGLALAFWTIIAFIIIQQIENHILVPSIMQKSFQLNPVIVLIALLIGYSLGGIVGFLVAVPVAAAVIEILHALNARNQQ